MKRFLGRPSLACLGTSLCSGKYINLISWGKSLGSEQDEIHNFYLVDNLVSVSLSLQISNSARTFVTHPCTATRIPFLAAGGRQATNYSLAPPEAA